MRGRCRRCHAAVATRHAATRCNSSMQRCNTQCCDAAPTSSEFANRQRSTCHNMLGCAGCNGCRCAPDGSAEEPAGPTVGTGPPTASADPVESSRVESNRIAADLNRLRGRLRRVTQRPTGACVRAAAGAVAAAGDCARQGAGARRVRMEVGGTWHPPHARRGWHACAHGAHVARMRNAARVRARRAFGFSTECCAGGRECAAAAVLQ
jgi:hypothetical protein